MARYYYLPSVRLCCLWSPKVGCTTLSNWLVRGILGNTTVRAPREYLFESGFRYDLSQIQSLYSDGSIENFVITTRDPYDRFVSCFVNKFINGFGRPILELEDMETNGRDILRRERLGFNWRGRFVGASFRELLAATLQSLAKGKSVNDHAGPQIESDDELEFIRSLGPAARFVDVRQFSESLSDITLSLGFKHRPCIPHCNKSSEGQGWVRDGSVGNERVRSRDFAQQRRIPTRDSLFTDSLSARFRAAFEKDFELFGLCSAPLKRCG